MPISPLGGGYNRNALNQFNFNAKKAEQAKVELNRKFEEKAMDKSREIKAGSDSIASKGVFAEMLEKDPQLRKKLQ